MELATTAGRPEQRSSCGSATINGRFLRTAAGVVRAIASCWFGRSAHVACRTISAHPRVCFTNSFASADVETASLEHPFANSEPSMGARRPAAFSPAPKSTPLRDCQQYIGRFSANLRSASATCYGRVRHFCRPGVTPLTVWSRSRARLTDLRVVQSFPGSVAQTRRTYRVVHHELWL